MYDRNINPMETAAKTNYQELFKLDQMGLTILMDGYAALFWRTDEEKPKPLSELPWKYQQPFFFTFLHDDRLSELFRNMEIIGAIDVYIKFKFFANEPLDF